MAKNSMFALSQKLETKQQQDRDRIEKHTLSELKRHAKNLRDGLSDELDTTKTDISDRLDKITKLVSALETTTKNRSQAARKALAEDLEAIERASRQNRQAALASIRWGWLRYSLPALLVLATLLAANWGLMRWQSTRLISMQEQIDEASQTLNQLPQGVRFTGDGAGKSYLVFENEPQIFRTQSGEWATELNR